MKKHYLVLSALLTASMSFGQQTITSQQNGNASSPLTWDCFCFPGTDDHIVINHQVGMDVDWLVNNGGSITVNGGGSLNQVGSHSIAFQNSGSMLTVNANGTFTMENMSVTDDAAVINNGTIDIDGGVFVGTSSGYQNFGMTINVDSILVDGNFSNAGSFACGDFLLTGVGTSSGALYTDSLGITGQFSSTGGEVYTTDFGTTGTVTLNNMSFYTVNDFYNTGDLVTNATTTIHCGNSFFSGDTIGGDATFQHNGGLGVMNDFYNADDLSGSGTICVNNYSYNSAPITGTIDFCDATGSDFDWNTGSIDPGVTYCNPGCTVQLDEEVLNWNVFPNPANDQFTVIGAAEANGVAIYALSGMKIADLQLVNGKCTVDGLSSGTYLVVLKGIENALPVRVVIE